MVDTGSAYSTTVKGVGRIESGWLSQTLYGGLRKWVIFFVLLLLVLVCGPPFGVLGMAYSMPPLYKKDPLTQESIQDGLYNYEKDKDGLKTMGWIFFVLFTLMLILYIVGWVVTARRYTFARTILDAAAAKKTTEAKKK